MANDGIRCKLLAKKSLTYDNTFSLAQATEVSKRTQKEMKKPRDPPAGDPPLLINYDSDDSQKSECKPPNPNMKKVTCYRCGGQHLAPACRIDFVCNYWNKKGHLARVCNSKARAEQHPRLLLDPPRKRSSPLTMYKRVMQRRNLMTFMAYLHFRTRRMILLLLTFC